MVFFKRFFETSSKNFTIYLAPTAENHEQLQSCRFVIDMVKSKLIKLFLFYVFLVKFIHFLSAYVSFVGTEPSPKSMGDMQ